MTSPHPYRTGRSSAPSGRDELGSVMTTTIVVSDVTFRHKRSSVAALDHVSIRIERGEFVLVMGPSGAGKSTFCQLLNGLVPHLVKGRLDGEVLIGDQRTADHTVAQLAERVGLVFQDFEAQLFSTNVRLEVAFAAENLGIERAEISRRVDESLRHVNLVGFDKRQPATLSGGQKQRLAIASVLVGHPEIICLDEPTTDLDPVGKLDVFRIADSLRERDVTLVVVEHETQEALTASRLVLMNEGTIVRVGPAREVLREVELFAKIGIQPLQIPELFAALGVAAPQRPLTVAEAARAFESGSLRVNVPAHEQILEGEHARTEGYGEPVIKVSHLSHRYSTGLMALDDVGFEIRRGEFVAVLGQNGSGKTTLVKHLNGLLRPTTGTIEVDGGDSTTMSVLTLGNTVGYVFQNPDHQIFSDTIGEEVAFGLTKRGLAEADIRERVTEALEAVGLGGREEEDPFSLTKGQRQRVAVASVLAVRPEVLILDEPTTGLDYEAQRNMMSLVKQLNTSGATIIIVTHAMWVVCEYAHRVIVMKDGHLVEDGTVREVFRNEDALTEMSLQAPPVVSLGNCLGFPVVSVAEMLAITTGGPH
jgi:energy-coupling factor transporter ATP-binding protein EcfA2